MSNLVTAAPDPTTGWNVWGHPRPVKDLQGAVLRGPGHSWILAGPGGSGKYLAAISFAKALSCPVRSPSNPVACNTCAVCRRIDRGVFPDVAEFSLARQAAQDGQKSRNLTLNVATVREIAATTSFRPSEAQWKIVIVRDAETMQDTAQEAFLKTLEEPPPFAVILLLTDDLEPVLPTIQSRCTVVRFGYVNEAQVKAALVSAGVDEARAHSIAEVADGCMGWAFQAANHAEVLVTRQQELNDARLLVASDTYDRLTTCVRLADEFVRSRESTFRMLALAQQVWRQELDQVLGLTGSDLDLQRAGKVVSAIRSIDRCVSNLEANVRPRLALEAMVATWPRIASQQA